jgi:pilus assembly protein Flp/PilA
VLPSLKFDPHKLAKDTAKMQKIMNFLKSEEGPTAVEYAVMLALIIVVCIGAVRIIGQNTNDTFTTVGTALAPVAAP